MAAEARSREREMKVKINFYNCEERYAVEEGLNKALKGTCREKGGLPRETGRGRRKEGNPHILNTVFFSSTPHDRAGDGQLPSGPARGGRPVAHPRPLIGPRRGRSTRPRGRPAEGSGQGLARRAGPGQAAPSGASALPPDPPAPSPVPQPAAAARPAGKRLPRGRGRRRRAPPAPSGPAKPAAPTGSLRRGTARPPPWPPRPCRQQPRGPHHDNRAERRHCGPAWKRQPWHLRSGPAAAPGTPALAASAPG